MPTMPDGSCRCSTAASCRNAAAPRERTGRRRGMWRNYLRTTLQILARNRVYAAINIGGLALGLAGCLLILNYVRYESSYDGWLPDSGRLYQVQSKFNLPGQPALHT